MKEIWSPLKIYEYLKSHAYPVPKEAYCTRNFSWRELLVKQIEAPSLPVFENLCRVTQLLQRYRNILFKNSPIIITSGWRSLAYNKKLGGATKSYHILGMALDFQVYGHTPQQVQSILDPVHKGGMEYASDWTHIDIRNENIRFDSKGKIYRKILKK